MEDISRREGTQILSNMRETLQADTVVATPGDFTAAMASTYKDTDESPAFQNLRILLLGASGVGKSATGNAILGREAFKEKTTTVSEIQRGRVEDRNISVIDTPGFFNTELTDEDLQNEIMKSLCHAHPGPHVFLLIINLKTFKEDDRNFVKQILDTFGEESLLFTMILFIGRENMSRREFTQFIENEKTEQMLNCFKSRHHVINSKNEYDSTQIKKLLKNIDVMVKNNGGEHYVTEIYLNRLREERGRKKQEHLEEELKKIREEVKAKHAMVEKKNEVLTKRQEELEERHNELKKTHEEQRRLEEVRVRLHELIKRKEVMKERHNDMMKKQEELTRRQEDVSKRHMELKKRHKELSQTYEERKSLLQNIVRREQRCMLRTMNSSELRIVLVGQTGSGRSSTGNTILGSDKFKVLNLSTNGVTKTCQNEEVTVDEKKVSVIDTPGIFDRSFNEEDLVSEFESCVDLSAPGPHAFLVVIRLDMRITEDEMNTMRWIQENFGENAARYTIILFTHADALEGKSLYEHLGDNNDLQSLVKICGGRCHSFSNRDKTNRSQVTELLEKIEEMVRRNGGDHYTNEMFLEAQKKIKIQTFWSQTPRIVLLGKSGSGKTASRKNILGEERQLLNPATKACEQHETEVDGKNVKIIDTPELFETSKEMLNMKILNSEIKKLFCMSDPAPHVFLLVIKLDGTSTEENTLKLIQENFGEDAVKHTIILFTHEDQLKGKTLNEHIRTISGLQELTGSCGGRCHSFNNKDTKNSSQVTQLLEKIKNMVEENGGDHYTNEMFQESQRKIHLKMFWSLNPSIVLLGKSGSGKTSTRKIILRQEGNSPNSPTKTCEKHDANLDGKNIRIIDTPGNFGTTDKWRYNIETFVHMSVPGPHVFLLVIRLGVGITEKDKNTLRWIQENISEDAAPYTIILFTHADHLRDKTVEECITGRSDLQALVNRCGGRYLSFNDSDRENQHQVTELLQKIETLAERNKWKYFSNDNLIGFMRSKTRFEKFEALAQGAISPITGLVELGVFVYIRITESRKKKAWDYLVKYCNT